MRLNQIFDEKEFKEFIEYRKLLGNSKKERFNNMLGIEYTGCKLDENIVYLQFPAYDWELNPVDIIHGGISASMADYAMGIVANCVCQKTGGYFAPTVNMNVNYHSPMNDKSNIVAIVKVVSAGRTLICCTCVLKNADSDEEAVTGTATYKILRKK